MRLSPAVTCDAARLRRRIDFEGVFSSHSAEVTRMHKQNGFAIIALLAALTACSVGMDQGDRRGSTNVITQEELQEVRGSSVYDAVQELRPRWLRARSGQSVHGSDTGIVVYVGNSRMGGIDELRRHSLDGVRSLQFLDSSTAASLPGIGSERVAGAIVISLSRN